MVDLERLRDRSEQLLRDPRQHRRIVNVLDDHHEFVTAQTCEEIRFAERAGQRTRDVLQELVADAVPERVVYVLEAIQIDEHHADALARPARL